MNSNNNNNQRSGGRVSDDMSHSSLNPTKDMMSGMDSGMDDNMMNRDRQGDDQGLMGKMASMVGGNKNNDQSGQNQSSKMMGGVGGGAGRDSNRGQEASMGDKVKGTYEQAKGKVMNDPHTARKGDMRKNPGGNDSNDFMTTSGI